MFLLLFNWTVAEVGQYTTPLCVPIADGVASDRAVGEFPPLIPVLEDSVEARSLPKLPTGPCGWSLELRWWFEWETARTDLLFTAWCLFIAFDRPIRFRSPTWKLKQNKTARIRAKPWMFRLSFKVYGAEITWKF